MFKRSGACGQEIKNHLIVTAAYKYHITWGERETHRERKPRKNDKETRNRPFASNDNTRSLNLLAFWLNVQTSKERIISSLLQYTPDYHTDES